MREDGSTCTCAEILNRDPGCICDRKHFNTLLWATVTVFQILTQEDWNVVLFNGMEKTSHWAALYFVTLMTFGNYVLFNLLVAILVEGFSAEAERKRNESTTPDGSDPPRLKDSAYNAIKEQERGESEQKKSLEAINSSEPRTDVERVSVVRSESISRPTQTDNWSSPLLYLPPIITHTAATPQGTPNATLESINPSHLSPKSALTRSEQRTSETSLAADGNSPLHLGLEMDASSLLRTPSTRSSASISPARRSSLSPALPQRSILGRKNSLAATPTSAAPLLQVEDADTSLLIPSGSDGLLRQGSKRLWKRLVGDPSTSPVQPEGESPTDEDRTSNPGIYSLLNNLNNKQTEDRLGNGGPFEGSYSRKQVLSHQNSYASPRTLSPQNSIHSNGSTPHSPSSFNIPPNNFNFEIRSSNAALKNEDQESEQVKKTMEEKLYERFPKLREREDYALFLFPPENKVRQTCGKLVSNKWFDHLVLCFIGLNCVTLAMERPHIPPDSVERLFLTVTNYVFTVVFGLEMLLKVIAVGLFYGEKAYFTSGWNIMDGLLVSVSVVDVLMSLLSSGSPRIFGILRVFRLLRSLRPLRVINRAPGLKLVVQTLLSSLKPIGNIVLICCTFFIIFGILGVQLFKGSFFYCEGPNIRSVRNKTDCDKDPRNEWVNRAYNFDNLGQALMALFVLSSKDGWVNIMYTGLDAVGVDQQPIENYSEWRLVYFISFLLLVGFFVLNMFVGVVVENFHRCREEQEKEERARRQAKRAHKMEKKRRRMRRPPYYINYSKWRLNIHNVVTSKYFDLAIAAVIGLNVVTMAMEFYKMPQELVKALRIFNYFFTSVFVVECVCKVVALGMRRYMKDKWNQLDMAIVLLSIVGIVLEELEADLIPVNPTIMRVMRVMRIARVLKLLKMAKGIRSLLDTVMQALPQVGNLGLLFYLLFFIFAALGVELFGRLECDSKHPCQGLGEHAHFANFGMAFLTLFRVATGDNWNGIMKDTIRKNCDPKPECIKNCCINGIIAPIFFVIFVLMAQFVLVNVVVAVLMKHLEESHKQMEEDLEMELALAAEFGPDGTFYQERKEAEEMELTNRTS